MLGGLYDMHGNLLEWCNDMYAGYTLKALTDPTGGDFYREGMVLRGGSYVSEEERCTSTYRCHESPHGTHSDCYYTSGQYVGFRICIPEMSSPPQPIFKPLPPKPVFPQNPTNGQQIAIYLSDKVMLELIYVKPGSFMMGSPSGERDEGPHRVRLTKGFWFGKYEVTQAQWESVMNFNPSEIRGENYPVGGVSWEDCSNFIHRVNGFLHCGARFPTEAEWEYACRAGTTTAYFWGDAFDGDRTNECGNKKDIRPVGSYCGNGWGFHDMHGNMLEWCYDLYGDYNWTRGVVSLIRKNFTDFEEVDPVGPKESRWGHVLRGGCSATRHHDGATLSFARAGFRLCCSAESRE